MKRILFISIFFCAISSVYGQFGGSYTYAYLQLPPSARISGLGGLNISTYDNDIAMAWQNPALLNEGMDGDVSANHAFLPSGISHGGVMYGKSLKNWQATMSAGIQYRTYGTFQLTEANGDVVGSFTGSEYALHWGIGYGTGKLRYGANVQMLYSRLESYSSVGMAADLAAAWVDTAKLMTVGLVMRNIGTQFKPYISDQYEELPFGIDLGVSKRLKHLPLRVSFSLHDLQTFDIRYDDPNAIQDVNIFSTDTIVEEKNYTVDKIAQHLNLGGEFYFGKNLMLRLGYDHMTRSEMAIETARGLTGFSMGVGMRIKKYSIDYGHEFYSQAGGSHHITIALNLNELRR